ncbi:MAG: DUF433 domain-containing protein [Clostridia bacterium]|nr:DUF433 domain-containing protein [Clostridia bacterium]
MNNKIVSTKDICSGAPRIDGTRLTCANVVQTLSHMDLHKYLEFYKYIDVSDIKNTLEYCMNKKCTEDKIINYCHQCKLCISDGEEYWIKAKKIHSNIFLQE